MKTMQQEDKLPAYYHEKKPNMKRRAYFHDYSSRSIYLVTLVIDGRMPLFGRVVGNPYKQWGAPEAPHIELTELGNTIQFQVYNIKKYYPQIEILDLQMMPDHLHVIIDILGRLPEGLGKLIAGFKTGCNREYKRLFADLYNSGNRHLFESDYNDRILYGEEELNNWIHYLRDNPRRLLVKRCFPEFFRVERDITFAGYKYSAVGNLFLLRYPDKLQIQCSRNLTLEEIQKYKEDVLKKARKRAVLVSPRISDGEKIAMDAALDLGYPIIRLEENGFHDFYKPHGRYFDACSEGRLLLLAPWQYHTNRVKIRREQCLALNAMAQAICQNAY